MTTVFDAIAMGIGTVFQGVLGLFGSIVRGVARLFRASDRVDPIDPTTLPRFDHEAFAELRDSPGFALLDARERAQWQALIGGGTNGLSAVARWNFENRFPRAGSLPESELGEIQAAWLRTQLREAFTWSAGDLVGNVPEVSPDDFDHDLVRRLGSYVFLGAVQPAEHHALWAHGREIAVVIPSPPPVPCPSLKEIGAAVARLTPEEAARINRIVISPVERNILTGDRDAIASAIANGRLNEVVIYPGQWSEETLFETMTHEVGHIVSCSVWAVTGPGWDAWQDAMRSDRVVPSGYGTSNYLEDFAETYLLYSRTLGTPAHDELRAIFGNRFALIDRLV